MGPVSYAACCVQEGRFQSKSTPLSALLAAVLAPLRFPPSSKSCLSGLLQSRELLQFFCPFDVTQCLLTGGFPCAQASLLQRLGNQPRLQLRGCRQCRAYATATGLQPPEGHPAAAPPGKAWRQARGLQSLRRF